MHNGNYILNKRQKSTPRNRSPSLLHGSQADELEIFLVSLHGTIAGVYGIKGSPSRRMTNSWPVVPTLGYFTRKFKGNEQTFIGS